MMILSDQQLRQSWPKGFGVFGTAATSCGFVGWLYKPLQNA